MSKLMRACLPILLVFLITNISIASNFEADTHFTSISPEPEIGKPGDSIEVVEFFMHGCPHCYDFEPKIQAWLKTKADDIEFVRIPALFGRHFDMHAQTYYALEAIGEISRLHSALFHEMHENKNRLTSRDDMEAFLAGQGVDMDKFRQAYNSFAVGTKISRARTLLKRYGIRGVPALVVDGRYKNAPKLGHGKMIGLIDFLAEKVRKERTRQ